MRPSPKPTISRITSSAISDPSNEPIRAELEAVHGCLTPGFETLSIKSEIESEKARLELLHQDNPNVIRDYESRQKQINSLQERVANARRLSLPAAFCRVRGCLGT